MMIALKDLGARGRTASDKPEVRAPGSRVVVPLEGLRKEPVVVRIPPRPERVRVQVSVPPSRPQAAPSPALSFEVSQPAPPQAAPPALPNSRLAINKLPTNAKPQQLSTGSPKLRLQHAPTISGTQMLRRPLNALPKPRQKLLIVLHVLPWLLLLVVASRLLPTPMLFENWPVMARTGATIGFGLYVLADTFFVVWHVAFRRTGRGLDRI